MIPHFTPSSVCVIDDDPDDYQPLLTALVHLGIGCMHIKGDSVDDLPTEPFRGLRLIFMDLHLTGSGGKGAASHAANIFRHVVSEDPAPIVVIIWSKYKDDTLPTPVTPESAPSGATSSQEVSEEDELTTAAAEYLPPADEQPTEVDLFHAALKVAIDKAYERIVFLEMPKSKINVRPEGKQWIAELEAEIKQRLEDHPAFNVLWSWEEAAKEAGLSVSDEMAKLAMNWPVSGITQPTLHDRLTSLLRVLAQLQGGPDSNAETVPHHLLTVFTQLGVDQMDRVPYRRKLDQHGGWLAVPEPYNPDSVQKASLNTELLTTPVDPADTLFLPGTIYKLVGNSVPEEIRHLSLQQLKEDCFSGKNRNTPAFQQFSANATPVFLELTPACDFHQQNRRSAILVAGLSSPEGGDAEKITSKEAVKKLPLVLDRLSETPAVVVIAFCSRHRFTIDHTTNFGWLQPWFRLRDVLATDFRKWHAEHASRVGYLQFL